MLKDWNGLEEVTEVTAFWGEGIGRNSHTLELQELGGYTYIYIYIYIYMYCVIIYLPEFIFCLVHERTCNVGT